MIKFMVIARIGSIIEASVMVYDALEVSHEFEDESMLKEDFRARLQKEFNAKLNIEIVDYQTMSDASLRYYIPCDPGTIKPGDVLRVIDQAS